MNTKEYRDAITELRQWCADHNIPKSQWPRYDIANWALVAGMLPGNDNPALYLTCVQMSQRAARRGIQTTPKAIHNIIQHMIRRIESIKKCRRNIGKSCYGVVKAKGDVEFITLPPDKDGFALKAYYFGCSESEIERVRAFQQIVKP